MEMMKRYFKYHFLNTVVRIPVMLFLSCAICLTTVVSRYKSWVDNSYYYSLSLGSIMTVFAFFAALIPVFELHSFNNRRNLDLWYSLPVSRPKILMVNYINGLIQILSVYIVIAVSSVLMIMQHPEEFILTPVFSYLAIVVLGIIAMYSLSFFIFGRSNQTVDGILFVFMYVFFVPEALISSVARFIYSLSGNAYDYYNGASEVIGSIGIVNSLSEFPYFFNHVMLKDHGGYMNMVNLEFPKREFVSLVIWVIVAIVCAMLGIYFSSKRDASKVQGISDSWFGYKVLIPYVFASFAFSGASFIVLPIYAGSLYVSYLAYRRGVRFKKADYIVIACLLLLYVAMCIITASDAFLGARYY